MAGRRITPLFDLISQSPTATPPAARPATKPAKPVIRVELKPREPSYTPEPTPRAAARPAVNKGYYIIVGVILALLMGWILGWSLGKRNGKKEADQYIESNFRRPAPNIQEPTEPGETITDGSRPNTQPPATNPTYSTADPRKVGLNYLYLAVLPENDATDAVKFLRANRLEAYAAPVDSRQESANNPSQGTQYRLFVLPGLSGAELGPASNRSQAAIKLEQSVITLGQRWKDERHGSSDFKRSNWVKFR